MTTPDAAASPITTSADRATARLLVAGQFVLLALLVVLPRRTDWPVPPAVRVGADLVSLSGLALAGVAAGTLGRGLTPIISMRACGLAVSTATSGIRSTAVCCSSAPRTPLDRAVFLRWGSWLCSPAYSAAKPGGRRPDCGPSSPTTRHTQWPPRDSSHASGAECGPPREPTPPTPGRSGWLIMSWLVVGTTVWSPPVT